MTTVEIIRDWLEAHGYDGLVNESRRCSCSLHDLMGPCKRAGDDSFECVQAVYDTGTTTLVEAVDPPARRVR